MIPTVRATGILAAFGAAALAAAAVSPVQGAARLSKGSIIRTSGGRLFGPHEQIFTANGPNAHLVFLTNCWNGSIDNLMVVPRLVYEAEKDTIDCKLAFIFGFDPASIQSYPYATLLDTAPSNWLVFGDAYFQPNDSEARIVRPPCPSDSSGGSFAIRQAAVAVPVSGLVAGIEYVLHFYFAQDQPGPSTPCGESRLTVMVVDSLEGFPGFEPLVPDTEGVTSGWQGTGTSRAAAWTLLDPDEFPDLYVVNDADNTSLFNFWPPGLLNLNGPDARYQDSRDVHSGPYLAQLADPSAGSGATFVDFDGDGHRDLLLVNRSAPNRLFKGPNFTDATPSVIANSGSGPGIAWADFDGDGDLDVFISDHDGSDARLLRNTGGSTFQNVTPGSMSSLVNTRDGCWGDYDGDGDLDLYISVSQSANVLFRNNGGTLTAATPSPLADTGDGRSVAWVDFDSDGDLDLSLANYGQPNRLFQNLGGGTFVDVAPVYGIADAGLSVCASWRDIDNDGDRDVFVVNQGTNSRLFRNDYPSAFADVTTSVLANGATARSCVWGDHNLDGTNDLYVLNTSAQNLLYDNFDYRKKAYQFKLVGQPPNTEAVGARLRTVVNGQSRSWTVALNTENGSQTPSLQHVGLGNASLVDSLIVQWPNGGVSVYTGLPPRPDDLLIQNEIWVDFGWNGIEQGTFVRPYNTLQEALNASPPNGTIVVKSGWSGSTMTINQAVQIRGWGGASSIGGP